MLVSLLQPVADTPPRQVWRFRRTLALTVLLSAVPLVPSPAQSVGRDILPRPQPVSELLVPVQAHDGPYGLEQPQTDTTKGRRIRKGLITGAAVGAAAGVAWVVLLARECDDCSVEPKSYVFGALVGAVLGAPIGAFLGYELGRPRSERSSLIFGVSLRFRSP